MGTKKTRADSRFDADFLARKNFESQMLRIDDETKRNDHKLLVRRVLHVYLGDVFVSRFSGGQCIRLTGYGGSYHVLVCGCQLSADCRTQCRRQIQSVMARPITWYRVYIRGVNSTLGSTRGS